MMFGTGEKFIYFQCQKCGCLQIAEIPKNLSDYYPSNYFSFSDDIRQKNNMLINFIYAQRLKYELGEGSVIGHLLSFFSRPFGYVSWLKLAGCDSLSRILDVGCGHGRLLLKMAAAGMENLTGIDPFIDNTITYSERFKIYKYDLSDCPVAWRNSFDLVMLHHSFEHMDEPEEKLHNLKSLLNSNGVLLIRIPVADCYAWKEYRESYSHIDPPRHFFLHTVKSMESLCDSVGMEIFHTDSVGEVGQFVGSELCRKGIMLGNIKKKEDLFSRHQLSMFRNKTKALNLRGEGAQRVFAIRVKS